MHGVLSIHQKCRFVSKVWKFHAQWNGTSNGTFQLHRPDPSHRAFGYCSCKKDAKERYWGL